MDLHWDKTKLGGRERKTNKNKNTRKMGPRRPAPFPLDGRGHQKRTRSSQLSHSQTLLVILACCFSSGIYIYFLIIISCFFCWIGLSCLRLTRPHQIFFLFVGLSMLVVSPHRDWLYGLRCFSGSESNSGIEASNAPRSLAHCSQLRKRARLVLFLAQFFCSRRPYCEKNKNKKREPKQKQK